MPKVEVYVVVVVVILLIVVVIILLIVVTVVVIPTRLRRRPHLFLSTPEILVTLTLHRKIYIYPYCAENRTYIHTSHVAVVYREAARLHRVASLRLPSRRVQRR